MREPPRRCSAPDPQPARRTVLKLAVVAGLAWPRAGIVGAQDAERRKARPPEGRSLRVRGRSPQGSDHRACRPAVRRPADHRLPDRPTAQVIRNDSRLNQVLLIRLDPADLDDETRARGAQGIVAYSAVCTHTGCDVWDWQPETRTIKCPCHFSTFDVKDGAPRPGRPGAAATPRAAPAHGRRRAGRRGRLRRAGWASSKEAESAKRLSAVHRRTEQRRTRDEIDRTARDPRNASAHRRRVRHPGRAGHARRPGAR